MDSHKTWSVPTSPRNPYKLPDELRLLQEFQGQKWERETQRQYAELLAQSELFEGSTYAAEPSFSARDRINRAPKTFGFVDIYGDNVISITKAGERLIDELALEDLFLRQLLKWQYPSLKHPSSEYGNFHIKPFLEILRLAYEIDGLSKIEIATFCVPFIDYRNYEEVKNEILIQRELIKEIKSPRERKRFLIDYHIDYFRKIYQEEIESGNYLIRQRKDSNYSEIDYLKTKRRNSIDYADAAIRYFRATGLFIYSSRNYRIVVSEIKEDLVLNVLNVIERIPRDYSNYEDYVRYLGNPHVPEMPYDEAENLISEILTMRSILEREEIEIDSDEFRTDLAMVKMENLITLDWIDLDSLYQRLQNYYSEARKLSLVNKLRNFEKFDEIVETYLKILDRQDIEIPDKPLFFEWNTWRAMEMLDDGDIIANLKFDLEGQPISNAPGKSPDIECYYDDFVLVIEVTLSSGVTQYKSESEPVSRHLGKIQKELRQQGDNRPIYGLFLANKINAAVVAHFYLQRKIDIGYYGGKVKFIPIPVEVFIEMLAEIIKNKEISSQNIHQYFDWADSLADQSVNEIDW